MSAPTPRDVLQAQLAEAVAEMQRLSDGVAICTSARAGIPTTERKYAEGRWAALREVQREVVSGQDVGTAAHAVSDSWASDLERQRGRRAGPDWVAYRSGGIDAVGGLIDQLAHARL